MRTPDPGPRTPINFRIVPVGDCAVSVEFANEISPEINGLVRGFELLLTDGPPPGVVATIPTYRSLLVSYDPLRVSVESLAESLEALIGRMRPDEPLPSRQITVPVSYDPSFAPDLEALAKRHGLSSDEVIALHTSGDYLVYFIGFTPGLPYLGGLPERLATPRLQSPRSAVPAGSVGIGGSQCAIYPVGSPGGFHIIGRTPLRLYDPSGDPVVLLRPGDRLRFAPISQAEFAAIEARAALHSNR
jgi:inhibitor of KinA